MYIRLLLLGILIPPISILLFFGGLLSFKRNLLVMLPVLVFLIFHSYFPNKQERFIIPIIPFIVMMGLAGYYNYIEKKTLRLGLQKFIYGSWVFFWSLNIILLPMITTMYSKRARVESMVYLSKYKDSIDYLLLEDTNHGTPKMPPEFYLGKWVGCYELSKDHTMDTLQAKLNRYGIEELP